MAGFWDNEGGMMKFIAKTLCLLFYILMFPLFIMIVLIICIMVFIFTFFGVISLYYELYKESNLKIFICENDMNRRKEGSWTEEREKKLKGWW
jgi:hypothetical protein